MSCKQSFLFLCQVKGSGTLLLFLFTMSVTWVADVIHGHIHRAQLSSTELYAISDFSLGILKVMPAQGKRIRTLSHLSR